MYYTYMLRCQNGAIYTGITTDPARRFRQHEGSEKGGAKYTKSNPPMKYEIIWSSNDRETASKLESRLKKLSKRNKEAIVNEPQLMHTILGEKLDTSLYSLENDVFETPRVTVFGKQAESLFSLEAENFETALLQPEKKNPKDSD